MAIPTVRLLAIGDIAWDILVHPAGEFVWGSDVYGSVDLLPGGSSANVAVWARRLGGRATLVGKIGDDRLGDLMQAHLETEQVAAGVTRVAGRPTTRIAIVIRPDGEHAFVTDHTQPLRLTAHDLPFSLLDEADVVFLNGYAVFMAGSAAFASAFLDEARRRRIPVAFDPSSFALVSAYGGARLRRELGALDVLLANEEELRALADDGSQESLFTASRLTVVKQGARGASAWRQGGSGAAPEPLSAPAVRVDAVDTTGAGDAFDAAFLVDYFTHGDLRVALAAANLLGGRVASQLGAQAQ
jgi:sugar/nucleoside kinase (ribokinase family)